MLYRVFIVQWYYPSKGDWTLQVKKDLDDLGMTNDIDKLKMTAREAFKKIVKNRAKSFAFKSLVDMKGKCSKLEKLNYVELKPQNYLKSSDFSYDEKRVIFEYRTRMARFSENFKAGNIPSLCPLCSNHSDSQFMIMNCPLIKSELSKNPNICQVEPIEDLFSND